MTDSHNEFVLDINTITYISSVASGGYALSVLMMSAASVGRDTFTPTTGQT